MDLLETYKKAWDSQPKEINQISSIEIYKMAHSKSSSIVKWIFIIGLLEFAFMIGSFFIFDTSKQEKMMEEMGVNTLVQISQYATIPVLLYFLFMFYKNYKNIAVTDSTKKLISTIKKTRRTVKNYVIFNLFFIVYISTIMTVSMVLDPQGGYQNAPGWIISGAMLIVTIILLLLFWLFYQVLYGFLLKKLNRNYKELSKL